MKLLIPIGCIQGSVRLSTDPLALGSLDICLNNTWGSVCEERNSWINTDERVACRQLGYSSSGNYKFLSKSLDLVSLHPNFLI